MHLRSVLLASFVLIGCGLQAKLEDHFKKIEGKSTIHHMKNIDFIYMINLDERPEKFQRCMNVLAPYGIYPYRFSAVNGWNLSLEDISDVGIKFAPGMTKGIMGTFYPLDANFEAKHSLIEEVGQTYFCHCMSRGAIGIVLSHLSVLQDAYDSGYETIWVMEDDIVPVKNPQLLSDLIDQLDALVGHNNWDVLFTDPDTKSTLGQYVPCFAAAQKPSFHPKNPNRYDMRQDIQNTFRLIGARYGAYSMIVRRSGIKKILDFLKVHKIFLPYDMEFTLPEGIRLYTVLEDIVSHQTHDMISDNGGPNYLYKATEKKQIQLEKD